MVHKGKVVALDEDVVVARVAIGKRAGVVERVIHGKEAAVKRGGWSKEEIRAKLVLVHGKIR